MARKKAVAFTPKELSADSRRLFEVLSTEPDLPAVLIATSYLEQCLLTLLGRNLIQGSTTDRLLDHRGPLGSFEARASLSYCLGLLPKGLFQNLTTVGQIRNLLAHSHLEKTLASEDVVPLALSLSLPKTMEEDPPSWLGRESPGSRFRAVVAIMSQVLVIAGMSERVSQVKPVGW